MSLPKPKCRSCGAEILWAETERGKMMPLDPEPTPEGNLVFVQTPKGVVVGHVRPLVDIDAPRYLSHFATCPNANEHRKDR